MDKKIIKIFFLVFFFNIIEGYVFPSFVQSNLQNFHTKVDYRSNLNRKSAYVEEYFNFRTGRGRLDVMTNGTLKTYLYDNRTQQILQFVSNKCTVYNDLKNSLSQLFDGKFYRWVDSSDPSKFPMIGPTALLRQVMRGITDKTLISTSSSALSNIRGIPCQTFKVTGNIFKQNTLTFYFADLTWNKFEQLNMFKRIPVRVTVAGVDSNNTPLNVDIDYFLFEYYSETWNDFLPPVGIGCQGKKSIKKLPSVPNQFSTTVEAFDIYAQRTTGIQQYVSRININYDGNLNLVKIGGFDFLEQNFKIIMDFNRGISYVFDRNQACQIRHIQNSPLVKDQNSIHYLKTVKELLGWSNNTYYLGKGYVRGIFCDVWERVMYKSKMPNSPLNTTFAKVVVTNYILDNGSIEVTNNVLGTDTPIMTIMTGYAVDGQEPTYRMEYNFFSFAATIYNFADYIDVFDVRNCFTESDMRKYIELYIPVQKANGPIAQKYYKQFRQSLAFEIAFEAQISPLRIPFLELDFGQNAIMANVMILDKERARLSFRKILPNTRPDQNSNVRKVAAVDDDECARKALAQNGKGFHWCQDKSCYIKMDGVIPPASPPNGGQNCTLFMLDAVNVNAYLRSSVNLTTALNNLNSFINKSKSNFSINLSPADGGKVVSYQIKKCIVSNQIVVDVYGNSLYNMTSNGFVINPKLVTTKTVKPSAGNTLSTIGDCYRSCKSETAIQCLSFSFCRNVDNSVRCLLSMKLVYDEMKNKSIEMQPDPQCYTYVMSYLNGYKKLDGQVILRSGDQNTKTANANLCAKQCTFNKKLPCKSFQYCQTGECFLRRKHFLDFDTVKSNSKSALNGCAFYSINYLSDYVTTGFNLVKDPKAMKFNGDSAEACAQHCSSQTDNCTSFNYCPANTGLWSYCELSSKSIYTAGVLPPNNQVDNKTFCRHYERNYLPNNNPISPTLKPIVLPKIYNSKPQNSNGMTSGSFFGLIFGLFILGIILGTLGFLGFQYYKREMSHTSGSGISVRFVRQDGDKASVNTK